MSVLMRPIYPRRVYIASRGELKMGTSQHDRKPETRSNPESAAVKSCCGGGDHNHGGPAHHDHHAHHAPATVRDPVCGMVVDPATSKHRFAFRGETFHFCSAGCQTKFAADPNA